MARTATQPALHSRVAIVEEEHLVRHLGLPLSVLLVVGACAGSPSAPPQADQQAKRFDQPPPDKGALYVYRSGLLGMTRPIDVSPGGRSVGPARLQHLHPRRRATGAGRDRLQGRRQHGNGQVQIDGGQTRFVEVTMSRWLADAGCEVAEVSPDQGQAAGGRSAA